MRHDTWNRRTQNGDADVPYQTAQIGCALHSAQCPRRPITLGGQRLEFIDERTTYFIAHYLVEILGVRAKLLEMHLRHSLMRLRAFHQQPEFHGVIVGHGNVHSRSCAGPERSSLF
jgi:hypothetical protein